MDFLIATSTMSISDPLKLELKKFQTVLPSHTAIKPLNESLSEYEARVLRQALIDNHWNQSKTARALQISEQTLRYKIGKLGIIRQGSRASMSRQ